MKQCSYCVTFNQRNDIVTNCRHRLHDIIVCIVHIDTKLSDKIWCKTTIV